VAAVSLIAALAPATASAQPTWAPADSAAIKPGNQTMTEGAQCTSNFVFYDASDAVYIGQAAHCSGTGSSTDTNGCEAESHPLGTPVEIEGASQPGTLVYNSWLTMQRIGESDQDTCLGNDFALVKLAPADAAKVNPSIPFWGGPVGIGGATATGDKVLSYQNSSLRFGAEPLKPKEGFSTGMDNGDWTHNVYTVTPGIPGDSGSAFLNGEGQAIGVLSVLEALPRPASNGVADVGKALAYAQANEGVSVTLANGTEPFSGSLLP
jgi:hypothetical protein